MCKLKDKKIIIVIISILIILVLIGLTYAFFTALITGNDTAKSTVVETGTLSIKYTNSNELRGTNVMPGWSETKTFTVENTGTVKATYNINWNNLLNEFINKEDLVYTINSNNNGETLTETVLPESGKHIRIISSIDIEPRVVQTYTLTVTYKNKDKDQTSDAGKKLIGKIEVLDINEDNDPKATDTLIDKYSKDNTEGLIKIEQPATVQTKENIEYRYSGSNDIVKNYVNFNNETWRIIGVFDTDDGTGKIEKRVKIIKDSVLAWVSYDSSTSGINEGYGINQWGDTSTYEGADLMRLLNPGYEGVGGSLYWNNEIGECYNDRYNATTICDFTKTGLNEKSKNMISDVKYYTSGYGDYDKNYNYETTQNSYIYEREQNIGTIDGGINLQKTINWVGKIALPYPSDYGYASSECFQNQYLGAYSKTICTNSNWMFSTENNWSMTLITPRTNRAHCVYQIASTGASTYGHYTYHNYGLKPTLYLKPSVKITKGTGTKADMYYLSL